jgi:hypothetical protein
MNRNTAIAILSLAFGTGWTGWAQEPDSTPVLNWSAFEAIAQKNIFDPSRSGRSSSGRSRPREVVILRFTYRGTMDDAAIFTGEGSPSRGYVKTGGMINGFKVMKITTDYVELAEPNGNLVKLNTDDSMQREDEGPWARTDQPAPLVITPSASASGDATAIGSSSSPSAGPANESDILKKLRLKREQEEK